MVKAWIDVATLLVFDVCLEEANSCTMDIARQECDPRVHSQCIFLEPYNEVISLSLWRCYYHDETPDRFLSPPCVPWKSNDHSECGL